LPFALCPLDFGFCLSLPNETCIPGISSNTHCIHSLQWTFLSDKIVVDQVVSEPGSNDPWEYYFIRSYGDFLLFLFEEPAE